MTIKSFTIDYDAINDKNVFTNGNTITGRIIVEVSKETRVQSLTFTAKGKAKVQWHENHGQHRPHVVFWANEKYYEIKQHILREARGDGSEILGPGKHVFPFNFNIPDRKMPSSFKAWRGKVVHQLHAQLNRSMRAPSKTKTKFTFVSKADMDTPGLMEPQYGCKDKSVTFFASGNISMDIHTERMGYQQGEALKVIVEVNNSSTRSVKPKFYLYEKKSFFAQGQRRVDTADILKEKGEPVASSTKQTVTKVITIPRELPPSILNCSIIKLEYRLKVVLDVALAKDPVVKMPIIVMPSTRESASKEQEPYWNQSLSTW